LPLVTLGAWASLLAYLASLIVALALQQAFLATMRRRIGPERSTPADWLTLARAAVAATLAALVLAGFRDRLSVVGWLAFATALIGATALDWLDGPLARRLGPTKLGGVLDIEADSWLTLWCAAGAVAWGGLPWWVLLAPLSRYLHPARALLRGGLPAGGGPRWSRVTGVAQMALLLGALLPVDFPGRVALLALTAIPISGGQLATMLALLFVDGDDGAASHR
jgi:phosphatidylglycerophosphate synthase